jgi:hypothetical protein
MVPLKDVEKSFRAFVSSHAFAWGSSTAAEGKVSKLAALAAARKKKETDKASGVASKQQSSSVALLDKLSSRGKTDAKDENRSSAAPSSANKHIETDIEDDIPRQTRKYPARKQKSPSPPLEVPERSLSQLSRQRNKCQNLPFCKLPFNLREDHARRSSHRTVPGEVAYCLQAAIHYRSEFY